MCTPAQMQSAADLLKAHLASIPPESVNFTSPWHRVLKTVSLAMTNLAAGATDEDWHGELKFELDIYAVTKCANDPICVKTDTVLTQALGLIAAYFDNTVEENITPIAVH